MRLNAGAIVTTFPAGELPLKDFVFVKKSFVLSPLSFQRHVVGLMAGTHPHSLSLHLHAFSNAVEKSEGNGSAFLFLYGFHYDAFCSFTTKHAKSGKKREIEGGIGVLIFGSDCHSFILVSSQWDKSNVLLRTRHVNLQY